MGIFSDYKEALKHAYTPGYSQQQQRQYQQQMENQRAAELDQQRRAYLNRLYGSEGSPGVDMSDEFSQGYLADGGAQLPAPTEGYGYAGSDRSADARMQFAMGLLSAPESATQARQLGAQLMNQYMQPEKPQSLPSAIQEYQFGQQQGFEGSYQDWKAANRAPGVTVNTGGGDPGDKPYSIAELKGIRNPQGEHPQLGATPNSLRGSDYAVYDTSDTKRQISQDRAQVMFQDMEQVVNALPPPSPGLFNMATEYGRSEFQKVAQTDPRYAQWQSTMDAYAMELAKMGAPGGQISDADLKIAMEKAPKFTDSMPVRKMKLDRMRRDAGLEPAKSTGGWIVREVK